jgi:carboxypeptidase C (cathepsin A)
MQTPASSSSGSPNTPTQPRAADRVRFALDLAGEFNGAVVRYRLVASDIHTRDDKGAVVASFFTICYTKLDVDDASSRPVTFLFNGGPGSSSQWLHLGGLAPKRVELPGEPRNAGGAPFSLVHNPSSILDVTDLVFIDPVGTGFSHAVGSKQDKDFWGLWEDARSIADLIQTWLSENQRWNSPKYVLGESYGTVRAALLAEEFGKRSISLNGVILVSTVLDYQNSRPRPGDGGVLSYVSYLPTCAATAWYHGKIDREGRTLESLLEEVRKFARTDYALALIANNRLSASERTRIGARVAAFTGLRESYIEHSRLRFPVERYFKELLRDRGLTIGRLDGRYTAAEAECAGEVAESDPSFDAVRGAFTGAMNAWFADLGVRMERFYVPSRLPETWNWLLEEKPPSGGGYINVVPHLGRAMRRNDALRVLVASGYFDFATPFFGAENALSQDGVPQDRLAYAYYEVGHMILVHEPSRTMFLNDVRRFISSAAD